MTSSATSSFPTQPESEEKETQQRWISLLSSSKDEFLKEFHRREDESDDDAASSRILPKADVAMAESRLFFDFGRLPFYSFAAARAGKFVRGLSADLRIPRLVDAGYVDGDAARLQRLQHSVMPDGNPMKAMLRQLLDVAPPAIPDYYELTPDRPDRKWMERPTTSGSDGGDAVSIPWIEKETYKRFIKRLKTELLAVEWNEGQQSNAFRYLANHNYEKEEAEVLSFRSYDDKAHHRVEYWRLTAYAGDAFVILQTAGGKLLVVGVEGGHSGVLCNLLDFSNSDGNTVELETTLPMANYKNSPKQLIEDVAHASEKYLYEQDH